MADSRINDIYYRPAPHRYDQAVYARCGNTGLQLPRVALGLWHNFGDDRPFQTQREIIRRAFDLGVFHFDLANNYGPPFGSAEENFGRILAKDFQAHRSEMIISTKAGWDMWDGPLGFGGSRQYLMRSLDCSLQRMGLDYVDIFYHHRPDPDTNLEETMLALHDIVQQGKAHYIGISSYSANAAAQAAKIARELGTPLAIHQPSYSLLNRWIEGSESNGETGNTQDSLLDVAARENMGVIAFVPLAQGLLTDKYLNGIPDGSRIAAGKLRKEQLTAKVLERVRALNEIAQKRGQTLAQMAIAWILRDQGKKTVTTALVGASSAAQLENSVAATQNLEFSAAELALIDRYAVESGVNLWDNAAKSRK